MNPCDVLNPGEENGKGVDGHHQPDKKYKQAAYTSGNDERFFVAAGQIPSGMPEPEDQKDGDGDGSCEKSEFFNPKKDEEKQDDVHEEVLDGEHLVVEPRHQPGAEFVGFVAGLLKHLEEVARAYPGVAKQDHRNEEKSGLNDEVAHQGWFLSCAAVVL